MRILETLSWAEIAAALEAESLGRPLRAPRGASIDSRTLEAGDIFFALKGEHVDGHAYVQGAFAKGAAAAVVGEKAWIQGDQFGLVVHDPEAALLRLAGLIRSRSDVPFVAITGSAGKTTAKEFTAEILRTRGPVLATRGNLNNHLGVPLTLARLETDHWAAVIECGMSHAGELSRLVRLVRPKVAAITAITAAHLENFASVADIARAKSEIFETLGGSDTAVAPADEPLVSSRALGTAGTARLFGPGANSSLRAADISMSLEGSQFQLQSGDVQAAVRLGAPGPHAISNFLAAAAIAEALGIPVEVIAAQGPKLVSGGNRGAVRRLQDDIILIDDTYNSNPRALSSAIETLGLAGNRRRVACIGEMLELGPTGPSLHLEAGAALGPKVDLLLGVGALARELVRGAETLPSEARRVFDDSAALASEIAGLVKSGDAVLVKGSRGVRMERVVEALVAAHPGVAA